MVSAMARVHVRNVESRDGSPRARGPRRSGLALAQLVHDFKGPLSLAALDTQLLLAQLDDGHHVEMVQAIKRVLLNLDYVERMVHDLIDTSAIDGDRFELRRRPTELRELLENVIARVPHRERIVLEARECVSLELDALRLERVIANLVQNALVYSARDSQVLVRLEVSRELARVSVCDHGPGIARGELAHVFEPFRRAATSYMHDGSGLGLYVSKQIVEAHGGRIGVQSTVGVGSIFYLELPVP